MPSYISAEELKSSYTVGIRRSASDSLPESKLPRATIGALRGNAFADMGDASAIVATALVDGLTVLITLDDDLDASTGVFTLPTGRAKGIAELLQDGTGSRTMTWPTGSVVGGTLKSTADVKTIADWYFDGTKLYVTYRA